jgi:hypothetical protein
MAGNHLAFLAGGSHDGQRARPDGVDALTAADDQNRHSNSFALFNLLPDAPSALRFESFERCHFLVS